HHHVEQDQVRRDAQGGGGGAERALADLDLVTPQAEESRHGPEDFPAVVDDEHLHAASTLPAASRRAGNRSLNVVPRPSTLWTVISPPCWWTISLTMA